MKNIKKEKKGETDPVKRYGKIIEILNESRFSLISNGDFYKIFEKINEEISKYYWNEYNARTRSATSKILWLKYRNTKIKIYDSRAKKALKRHFGEKS